jgi:hypothetical protein
LATLGRRLTTTVLAATRRRRYAVFVDDDVGDDDVERPAVPASVAPANPRSVKDLARSVDATA